MPSASAVSSCAPGARRTVEIWSIKDDAGARLARPRLSTADRSTEALAIFRALSADENAGVHQRHAKEDLEFLEFKLALQKRRR